MPLGPIIPISVRKDVNKAIELGQLGKAVLEALGTQKQQPAIPPEIQPTSSYDGRSSLNEFISTIKGENGLRFAKSTHFYVDIEALPKTLFGEPELIGTQQAIRFLCNSANFPGMVFSGQNNIKDFTNSNFGLAYVKRTALSDFEYADLNLTFYVDQNFEIKKLFDKLAVAQIDNRTFEAQYYNDYVFDITVHAISYNTKKLNSINRPVVPDQRDIEVYAVRYHNCMIKLVQDIQMSWSENSTPPNFTVSFGYETFTVKTLDGGFTDSAVNLFGKTVNEDYIEKLVAGGAVNTEALQDASRYVQLKQKTIDFVNDSITSLPVGIRDGAKSFANSLNISNLF